MTATQIALLLLVVIFGFVWLQQIIYRRHWNKGLIYTLRSSKPAVFEGETVTITDRLTNAKKLPMPWVHISYRLSRFLVYLDNINTKRSRGERREILYVVGTNKTVSRKSTVLCEKRGFYTAADFIAVSNNIFMTELMKDRLDVQFGLLVYPRLVNYTESVIPLKQKLGDIQVRRFTDPDPFTFKGIREYQPFDSFRQINWGATAKTGTLMTNIYDHTVSQDVTVLLNMQDFSRYDMDFVHEEAIRLAAFVCRECIGMGIPVSLVCPAGSGRPVRISSGMTKSHLEMLYAALAYIDLTAYNDSVADYLQFDSDKSCILISSYHDEDIYEKFMAARKRGAGAFWIIPHYINDVVDMPASGDILKWGVRRDDKG